jgi:hypothetical protein
MAETISPCVLDLRSHASLVGGCEALGRQAWRDEAERQGHGLGYGR